MRLITGSRLSVTDSCDHAATSTIPAPQLRKARALMQSGRVRVLKARGGARKETFPCELVAAALIADGRNWCPLELDHSSLLLRSRQQEWSTRRWTERKIVGRSDGLRMTSKSLTIRVHGRPRPCGSCATN